MLFTDGRNWRIQELGWIILIGCTILVFEPIRNISMHSVPPKPEVVGIGIDLLASGIGIGEYFKLLESL